VRSVSPVITREHRRLVERASCPDCDGILWNGQEPWPDGRALSDMFWLYYAPLIPEDYHGRALRALVHATPHGMKAFATQKEFRAMLVDCMTPFLKRGQRFKSRPGSECAWCGRPGAAVGAQCQGCGAWCREGR
jgi:hypothetical protein